MPSWVGRASPGSRVWVRGQAGRRGGGHSTAARPRGSRRTPCAGSEGRGVREAPRWSSQPQQPSCFLSSAVAALHLRMGLRPPAESKACAPGRLARSKGSVLWGETRAPAPLRPARERCSGKRGLQCRAWCHVGLALPIGPRTYRKVHAVSLSHPLRLISRPHGNLFQASLTVPKRRLKCIHTFWSL